MQRGKLSRFLKPDARKDEQEADKGEEAYFQLRKAEHAEWMLDLDGHSANEDY